MPSEPTELALPTLKDATVHFVERQSETEDGSAMLLDRPWQGRSWHLEFPVTLSDETTF